MAKLKANLPIMPELAEGIDYTVDDGRWVFTAAYLLGRGFCCGSGCRNCPYDSPPEPAKRTNDDDERCNARS